MRTHARACACRGVAWRQPTLSFRERGGDPSRLFIGEKPRECKRGKRRTIDLRPFDGVNLVRSLPAYVGSPLLFWHSAGEDYKNFASQFSAIVERTAKWAKANGVEFRPFRFHHLRHLHAIEWLRSGRSIYELQHRLGHASIATTEVYLRAGYLTFEQIEAAKAATPGRAPSIRRGRRAA